MRTVADHEARLAGALRQELETIRGLRLHRMWSEGSCDRVGIAMFTLDGWRPDALAAALAQEYAIGVRSGRFCAHALVAHLLRSQPFDRGVRTSLGLPSRQEDVDAIISAFADLADLAGRGGDGRRICPTCSAGATGQCFPFDYRKGGRSNPAQRPRERRPDEATGRVH